MIAGLLLRLPFLFGKASRTHTHPNGQNLHNKLAKSKAKRLALSNRVLHFKLLIKNAERDAIKARSQINALSEEIALIENELETGKALDAPRPASHWRGQ